MTANKDLIPEMTDVFIKTVAPAFSGTEWPSAYVPGGMRAVISLLLEKGWKMPGALPERYEEAADMEVKTVILDKWEAWPEHRIQQALDELKKHHFRLVKRRV